MEAPRHEPQRSVDVTGLPGEAVRAVELLVSQFRVQQPARLGGTTPFSSRQEWAEAARAWAESHPARETPADDSRESIYADDRDE